MSPGTATVGPVSRPIIDTRPRLSPAGASRRLCRLLWVMLAIVPTARAAVLSGEVLLQSLGYHDPVPVSETFGPSWANIRLSGATSGFPEFGDSFAGQIVAQYDEQALLGSTVAIPLRFSGTPDGSRFATDAGMNATATVHVGVDPIRFSAVLASIGAHFDGSQSYTAGVDPVIELTQTEDFIGLGGNWTYEILWVEFAIGAEANITNIRRDTLRHTSFIALLDARHRDSGSSLADEVHLFSPTDVARFRFTEPGWWDVDLRALQLHSSVLTEQWWGVSADLWYAIGHDRIVSPPVGPAANSYSTPLSYQLMPTEPFSFPVFVRSGAQPVHEAPAAVLLGLGLGLAGLGLRGRRRSHRLPFSGDSAPGGRPPEFLDGSALRR